MSTTNPSGYIQPVPLWVELCCGSAAVTLKLIGGPKTKPPVSYMGSKQGYAETILQILGLNSGTGAKAVCLVEAGPWSKVWRLLTTPEGCRAVAAVIRGWVGEDARALWDRLRAEPVPDGWGAREVGAWLYTNAHSRPGSGGFRGTIMRDNHGDGKLCPTGALTDEGLVARVDSISDASWPPVQVIQGDVAGVEPRDVAAWLYLTARSMGGLTKSMFTPEINTHASGGTFGADRPCIIARSCAISDASWPPVQVVEGDVAGEKASPEAIATWCCLQDANVGSKEVSAIDGAWDTAGYAFVSRSGIAKGFLERLRPDLLSAEIEALASFPWPPIQVVEGNVAQVSPREVARWLWLMDHVVRSCGNGKGDVEKMTPGDFAPPGSRWGGSNGGVVAQKTDSLSELDWPPTIIAHCDARHVQPVPPLPKGTIVYMDPPYQNTTGYAHTFPREKVVEVALRWAAAGATVCVSEAEPLADLVAQGWHSVEITSCRKGQKRTFSKQKREWLTLNREPAWVPPVQQKPGTGTIFELFGG